MCAQLDSPTASKLGVSHCPCRDPRHLGRMQLEVQVHAPRHGAATAMEVCNSAESGGEWTGRQWGRPFGTQPLRMNASCAYGTATLPPVDSSPPRARLWPYILACGCNTTQLRHAVCELGGSWAMGVGCEGAPHVVDVVDRCSTSPTGVCGACGARTRGEVRKSGIRETLKPSVPTLRNLILCTGEPIVLSATAARPWPTLWASGNAFSCCIGNGRAWKRACGRWTRRGTPAPSNQGLTTVSVGSMLEPGKTPHHRLAKMWSLFTTMVVT